MILISKYREGRGSGPKLIQYEVTTEGIRDTLANIKDVDVKIIKARNVRKGMQDNSCWHKIILRKFIGKVMEIELTSGRLNALEIQKLGFEPIPEAVDEEKKEKLFRALVAEPGRWYPDMNTIEAVET